MRLAAVGRIDGAEAIDQAGLDRAQRNLVGRIPVAVVAHRGDAKPVASSPLRVFDADALSLRIAFWQIPRTIVVLGSRRRNSRSPPPMLAEAPSSARR